jgi:hypothetical protein
MHLQSFLSGGVFIACIAIALLFLRINRKAPDRLFVYFAIAFGVLALERVILVTVNASSEYAPYAYLIRLLAYICIIGAIIDKNRRA